MKKTNNSTLMLLGVVDFVEGNVKRAAVVDVQLRLMHDVPDNLGRLS